MPINIQDIMDYEEGKMDQERMIKFFQNLIDTGYAWQLQGHYSRQAKDLIGAGLCTECAHTYVHV
jgi:hypothetical protein